ncbi:MAG TPA: serine/threonine-protein kinase [Candidatus Xenobia bacterium]|jgi:hypothetical protein
MVFLLLSRASMADERPFPMHSYPPYAMVYHANDLDAHGVPLPGRNHAFLGVTDDPAHPVQLRDQSEVVTLVLKDHQPVTLPVSSIHPPPPEQTLELTPDNLVVRVKDALFYSHRLHEALALLLIGLAVGAGVMSRRVRHVKVASDEAIPTFINRVIDGYTVVGKLGEGAFSQVYKGVRVENGETVAIKVLRREYLEAAANEVVTRFNRETMVQLIHPHVVTVFAAGDYMFRPYIILEFINGSTIRDLLKPRLDVAQTVRYFLQMCDGLAFAHRRGYIHRDLKPENIMVNDRGTVKIMDFGIAKHLNRPAATRTATTMGTPLYMSPEHLDSNKTDARSDIYSMGVILFEMLTGQVPFDGTLMELIGAHMFTLPKRITELDDTLPVVLADIVTRMLEKAPEARFQTMEEVSEALSAAGRGLGIADL